LEGVKITTTQLRDDRKLPPLSLGKFTVSNFVEVGGKRSHDLMEIMEEDQGDPAYYNCVYMPNDKYKNDILVPLVKDNQVCNHISRRFALGIDYARFSCICAHLFELRLFYCVHSVTATDGPPPPTTTLNAFLLNNLLQVVSVAVIVNKLSIAPDIKGHPGFDAFLTEYKKADSTKKPQLLGKLQQLVTKTEHEKNVAQAKLPKELAKVVVNYVAVLIELPFTQGGYDLSGLPRGAVPLVVNKDNLSDFFGQKFAARFNALLEQTMQNYKQSIEAAAT
jgi:hypothetical protein